MILKCSKGHTRSLRPGLGKTRVFVSPTCLVAEAAAAERGNWCDWILAISFNTVRLMFLDPWMSRLDLQSGERSMDPFSMNFLRGQGIPKMFQDTLLGLNFLQPRWASYPAVMRLHQSRTSPQIQIDRMAVQGNNLPPTKFNPKKWPLGVAFVSTSALDKCHLHRNAVLVVLAQIPSPPRKPYL